MSDKLVLEAGDVSLDRLARTVLVDGRECRLTLKEFELLELLMLADGTTVTRRELAEKVWHADEIVAGTINFHIYAVRRKLAAAAKIIQAVRGRGYRISKENS